jgi:hypothetical protein
MQKGDIVLVLSQLVSRGEVSETTPAMVVRALPDVDTGNITPGATPVIADIAAPFAQGPLTFNVYDVRSSGGNATLDQHGFAFLVDDVTGVDSVPVGTRVPPKK